MTRKRLFQFLYAPPLWILENENGANQQEQNTNDFATTFQEKNINTGSLYCHCIEVYRILQKLKVMGTVAAETVTIPVIRI
jgi:hypothetical protein